MSLPQNDSLLECIQCGSTLLQVVNHEVEEVHGEGDIWVDFRCPECYATYGALIEHDEFNGIEQELNQGTTSIVHDLEILLAINGTAKEGE